MRLLMRRSLPVAILVMVCAIVSKSLSADAPVKVAFQMDWIHNVQFAGVHWALQQGFFEDQGIDLEMRPVVANQATVEAVLESNLISFGSAESNVILSSRARGLPIVAIGTMFQDSPMGWMSLESSGIERIADLKGRRIGIHPDGEKVINLMLRRSGLSSADVTLVTVGYDPQALIRGEIDAMQGYVIDEFVKLQLLTQGRGRMLLAKDHGYSAYSQVVFTTEDTIRSHPQVVQAFMRALQLGWQGAFSNLEPAVDLTISRFNPKLDRQYQIESLKRIRDLISPNGIAPLSKMSLANWEKGQQIYLDSGLLSGPVDLGKLVILDFLPAN